MKKILLLLLLIASTATQAQYNIRLVVTSVPSKTNDDIYVAGSFNNWNPKDENYKLKPFGGSRKAVIIKDVAAGNYAFKFTRGSFQQVECMADGRDISDRVIEVNNDVVLEYSIAGWKDDYPDKPKPYTASPQVRIIDTAFKIPQLNRTRRIWIYLPKSYVSSGKTYPVMYMHDGQNLFNEQTAFAGEWGVDECLDTLQKQTGKECIIIGIDNGGAKRMNEYNPYEFDKFGKGEGKLYVDFLATVLKPHIDAKYRTKKGVDYTFIAGSSMGGLISLQAVLQYPQVFGGAGIFSPAFWTAPQLFTDAAKINLGAANPKLYFYAGGKENATMVSNMEKMIDVLKKQPNYIIRSSVSPLNQHNEKAWRAEFPAFYKWIMQ
ncbi:MAG: alpha/beta hydrolase [Bacteroidetes bacterium]|nr:alpha/beta hydrolase [Bacteroidota bacterium]MBS1671965.1 alpha/beta hydrolase [Bacteroidota bacterium]